MQLLLAKNIFGNQILILVQDITKLKKQIQLLDIVLHQQKLLSPYFLRKEVNRNLLNLTMDI
jgi:hypothetical protein